MNKKKLQQVVESQLPRKIPSCGNLSYMQHPVYKDYIFHVEKMKTHYSLLQEIYGQRIIVGDIENNMMPIELRPSYRTIKVKRTHSSKPKTYRLAFPYMQFFVSNYRDGGCRPGITWSFKSISSWEDGVFAPLIPNIWSSGKVCVDLWNKTSISMCNQFWATIFTPYEDDWPYDNIHETVLKSLSHWELMSEKSKHPLDVFEHYCDDRGAPLFCFMFDNFRPKQTI